MDSWAVIKTGGKQYKVTVGQSIEVEKLDSKAEGAIVFDEILAIKTEKDLKVGKPLVEKAKVRGKVIENFKD